VDTVAGYAVQLYIVGSRTDGTTSYLKASGLRPKFKIQCVQLHLLTKTVIAISDVRSLSTRGGRIPKGFPCWSMDGYCDMAHFLVVADAVGRHCSGCGTNPYLWHSARISWLVALPPRYVGSRLETYPYESWDSRQVFRRWFPTPLGGPIRNDGRSPTSFPSQQAVSSLDIIQRA
jgi:hypothetical protein